MGAGIHGGFGYTKGYREAVALNAVLIGSNGDLLKKYASRIKSDEGFYDVIIHGTDNNMQLYHPNKVTNKREGKLKGWADITQKDLAKYLKKKQDYKGEPIRLLSCNTGKKANGLAQNLANKMNVLVKAPNKTLYVHASGKISIGESPLDNSGKWVIFKPKKTK